MDPLWATLGYSKLDFHHSSETIILMDGLKRERVLAELCRSVVPPCRLNALLFNGHLQTIWTMVREQDVPIYYRRKVFEAEDPAYAGSFAVDFVADPFDDVDPSLPPRTAYFTSKNHSDGPGASLDARPMLVALHGLSGGSHELYLRYVLAPLASKDGGWEACVVNARGCAMSEITSTVLFNARATWDIRQVVRWLRKRYPNRPLFGTGFSLGANILVNYLGEEGSRCQLEAAVVCSNPWNLEISSMALLRTVLGREIYSKTMANNLKKLVGLHKNQVIKNTRVDLKKLFDAKYLHEFDREIQCPTWGYPTVGAYYRDASSSDSLLAVRTPLFAINAEDDPIASREGIPYEEFQQNPYTVLCTTSMGGHLAWFESSGGRWFVKPMTAFLAEMAKLAQLGNELKPSTRIDGDATHFDPMRRKLDIKGTQTQLIRTMTRDLLKSG